MSELFTVDAAEALIRDALLASDVSPANATSVARALVAAEIDGQKGHGFSRLAAYAAQARAGKVAGHAVPRITRPFAAAILVDAGNGFAFPAIDAAIDALAETAPETGIAMAGIRRSHHCGQLGAHVERLAERGLIALMVANSPKAMAPWGGSRAVFGTNPIAFATPREGAAPLVIDLSLSKVARGRIMAAAQAGQSIPEGWALDAGGRPTTDPAAALAGTMIPLGDAKGAALALVVEILSASLIGANHAFEASSFFDAEGPPPGVGQTIIAFRPGVEGYGARLETLLRAILSQEGTRLPGAGKAAARRRAAEAGLEIPEERLREIRALLPGAR
ncbi:MAG TPA: Ldh family oxidoreductase [Amaricoccus sp.]|uniref:Ldh family oxidoreductase n=1 Tax=Amaricoccus sp. TaxID=1872485 RepID=UPI002C0C1291|nr:Ldh family oxidoreductase [Amaricoccus sp.]HMQ91569.1 Ldh family oxidoreductase [Amaricoccus sp.]HMR51103.1 Ldh family oxidoreductase [Amaricoccus sp.]HMR59732.1 Ldh family oxidoreductase [Amaricoccus sp.]HMT98149.1 Ldh family oxidoreductase [Amaricoccus sp.]